MVSETYYHTCGRCMYCRTGHGNLCPEKKSIGSAVNGAMADYVVVPEKNLHLIPEGISLREAAMTEPLACCVQGVLEFGDMIPGDRVLILDDFLARGSALRGLIQIVEQSGASLAGCGVAIEKGFQEGGAQLRRQGIRVESLAIVEEMGEDGITFRR